MEIKTCEQYVLSQLEYALKQLEDSKNEIERLNIQITSYNKQLTKCRDDIDYLQRLFIANGSVQSEVNHGIKHLEVTYKFKLTSTEVDTTELYNFRKLLEILNIDDNKCYKDNEEE
jgi:hypothetical protein